MHILVLNTQLTCAVGSPQYVFAEADLALTNKTWRIVMFHKPAYCSGGEGSNAEMRIMSTNIFEPNHVDMAITGHSHFYQHNFVNGIHHMVLGAGGGPLQEPIDTFYTIKSIKDYNWATVDVSPTQFLMTVYNDSNKMLDTVRLIKNPGYINHEGNNVNKYELFQNYPNPFNPRTVIRFSLPATAGLRSWNTLLKVYDINGREVQTLVNEKLNTGIYSVEWDASEYPSGVYFYKLQAGDFTDSKKLILLK
jgi:hypothetical protein